jgi:hypothetical protein
MPDSVEAPRGAVKQHGLVTKYRAPEPGPFGTWRGECQLDSSGPMPLQQKIRLC